MYDFIVVGAGSAGCVIAEGLSARHSVLLLEAGGSDRVLEVAIPAAFTKQFMTERDWAYQTEPEPHASDRSLYLPRGKMLGGSSSMNAMIYMRGRPSDYDGWSEMGATGWGWNDVLPVFIYMERNQRGASALHGSEGPVRVEDLRYPNTLARRFVDAAVESGISPNDDFNGASQDGVGFYQVTQRRGRRWSAADAYLRPAIPRPTLDVLSNALVTRVLFDGKRATGVEYLKDGVHTGVSASSEVILSAGAIGSPQILQISGVGDPDHLTSIGIEVVSANSHVGAHFQDHPAIGVIQASESGGTLDDAESPLELVKWALLRKGRLTSNVAEAGAFVRSSPELAEPDLQFHFGPAHFENHGRDAFDGHAYSLGPALLNPRSRGSVRAVSPDPTDVPAIRGNYLEDPQDLKALRSGFDLTRKILSASSFDAVRGLELVPGPSVVSGADIESFIRDRCEGFYHPVGTCRMGRDVNSTVVDPQLRVHGISGLRVADASVMPAITSGNPNAPTMMIGARAVEMILSS